MLIRLAEPAPLLRDLARAEKHIEGSTAAANGSENFGDSNLGAIKVGSSGLMLCFHLL